MTDETLEHQIDTATFQKPLGQLASVPWLLEIRPTAR